MKKTRTQIYFDLDAIYQSLFSFGETVKHRGEDSFGAGGGWHVIYPDGRSQEAKPLEVNVYEARKFIKAACTEAANDAWIAAGYVREAITCLRSPGTEGWEALPIISSPLLMPNAVGRANALPLPDGGIIAKAQFLHNALAQAISDLDPLLSSGYAAKQQCQLALACFVYIQNSVAEADSAYQLLRPVMQMVPIVAVAEAEHISVPANMISSLPNNNTRAFNAYPVEWPANL